jgi:hypothetical protein
MSPARRHAFYRVAHDTGLPLRRLVRECRGLAAIDIARRYGVLAKPPRCG